MRDDEPFRMTSDDDDSDKREMTNTDSVPLPKRRKSWTSAKREFQRLCDEDRAKNVIANTKTAAVRHLTLNR